MKQNHLLPLALAALLALYPTATAQAAEISDGSDVSPSVWAQEEVQSAIGHGFLSEDFQAGIEDYTAPISRTDFAVLAVCFVAAEYGFSTERSYPGGDFTQIFFEQHPNTDGQPYQLSDYTSNANYGWAEVLTYAYHPFSDIPSGFFYDQQYTQIHMASLMGIVNGRPDGTFDPDGNITRQEAAVMLQRVYDICNGPDAEPQPLPFPDADEIGDWALSGVQTAYSLGLMNGTADGTFCPNSPYTVEQAIVTFERLYESAHETLVPLRTAQEALEANLKQSNLDSPSVLFEHTEEDFIVQVTLEHVMFHGEYAQIHIISGKGGFKDYASFAGTPESFHWDDSTQQISFYYFHQEDLPADETHEGGFREVKTTYVIQMPEGIITIHSES